MDSPRIFAHCVFQQQQQYTNHGYFLFFIGSCGNPDAKRLYDDLLSNYNKLVRPVVNVTDAVKVRLKLKLSQLIDVVSSSINPVYETISSTSYNGIGRYRNLILWFVYFYSKSSKSSKKQMEIAISYLIQSLTFFCFLQLLLTFPLIWGHLQYFSNSTKIFRVFILNILISHFFSVRYELCPNS